MFNWSIDDGPFQPLFIVFEQMTLELLIMDEDGDGVPDEDDLCPGTVIPESVPTRHLGVNRWALVDDDHHFDTMRWPHSSSLDRGQSPVRHSARATAVRD